MLHIEDVAGSQRTPEGDDCRLGAVMNDGVVLLRPIDGLEAGATWCLAAD